MNELFGDNKNSGAQFSECGKFRYQLWRVWDEAKPKALVIGLNPSTANADKPDPTITNLKIALVKLGYGGFVIVNCFPIISPKPGILKGVDINDDENTNNQYIVGEAAKDCQVVIFAWGAFPVVGKSGIDKRWESLFPSAQCFGKSKNGKPWHPLFLMWSGNIKAPSLINYFNESGN